MAVMLDDTKKSILSSLLAMLPGLIKLVMQIAGWLALKRHVLGVCSVQLPQNTNLFMSESPIGTEPVAAT